MGEVWLRGKHKQNETFGLDLQEDSMWHVRVIPEQLKVRQHACL